MRIWRQCISGGLLLLMLLAFVGVPLRSPQVAKQGRFPCEHCPCGCASAETCWDRCCCHTDAEKIRWAQRNDVVPPDFLVARWQASSTPTDSSTSSCCARCNTQADRDELPAAAAKAESGSGGPRLLLLQRVAKCRGLEIVWTLLSNSIVDTVDHTLANPQPPLFGILSFLNESANSRSQDIDPPVP
ncbi:hypothetical protein NHH03_09320 [Stieleria sp. TO1_6]|uniref:hypothetical protein n=1 Tax=Stieleria tagensis TaxID=2956795 RepID=UPI00209B288F|nr:hypothetical protein [Stieleria tagensis]MCO8121934.1 hypothetical protein [Stieleria tagensis]